MAHDFVSLPQSSATRTHGWAAETDSTLIYLQQMPALTLMDRLQSPVVAVDSIGAIGYVNGAFLALLGYYKAAQVTGLALDSFVVADGQAVAAAHSERVCGPIGSTVAWRHRAGYLVTTVVWPIVRLRVFDPFTVMVLTEAGATADGLVS